MYLVAGDSGLGAGGWGLDEDEDEGKGEERLSPPICTTAVMGSRRPDKYFSGSAVNFATQPFEQKW